MPGGDLLKTFNSVEDGIGYIDLTGSLVAESRHEFKSALRRWANNGPKQVVARMSALNYMDSAGLAALIGAWKQYGDLGGEFIISELSPTLQALFQVSSLEKFFKIFPTSEEATAYFKKPAKAKSAARKSAK